jgi:hypothetical protein
MRLWSLHPKYLDTKGLTAAWREGLLAQKVLQGETLEYRNHPQLERFKRQPDPDSAIAAYLTGIYEEARRRGYHFDESKIAGNPAFDPLPVTQGQLLYEWALLKQKLQARDPQKHGELLLVSEPEAHPLFEIVPGEVEGWERLKEL